MTMARLQYQKLVDEIKAQSCQGEVDLRRRPAAVRDRAAAAPDVIPMPSESDARFGDLRVLPGDAAWAGFLGSRRERGTSP